MPVGVTRCSDASNALSFNGSSFIRINPSTTDIKLTFSFRTHSKADQLLQVIYFDEKTVTYYSLSVQLTVGRVHVDLNDERILLPFDQVPVDDGLWHELFLTISYAHRSLLVRLDHVFSRSVRVQADIASENLVELIIGHEFHGCLDNLRLNNIAVIDNHRSESIEFVGTARGCSLEEALHDDVCSLHRPCYHGGTCTNQESSYACQCLKPRFVGHQCQIDLQPCDSHPCAFDEQCLAFASGENRTFSCISSAIRVFRLSKTPFYLGFAVIVGPCLLILVVLYCRRKQRACNERKTLVIASPSLTQKPSPMLNSNPVQTLLKLNYTGKQTIETLTVIHQPWAMNRRVSPMKRRAEQLEVSLHLYRRLQGTTQPLTMPIHRSAIVQAIRRMVSLPSVN